MGCGTGWLACRLAALGHTVTGADPATAVLDIARRRPGADAVTWIETRASDLSVDTRFDLIIMTGHAFQVFLDDDEALSALTTLRRHLAPDGRLAFETRNPSLRPWENWTPAKTNRCLPLADGGSIWVHHDVRSVSGQTVTYETHFSFNSDESVVSADTLRFADRGELAALLLCAGFTETIWYGDWDRSPFRPDSLEIIVVAR